MCVIGCDTFDIGLLLLYDSGIASHRLTINYFVSFHYYYYYFIDRRYEGTNLLSLVVQKQKKTRFYFMRRDRNQTDGSAATNETIK